MDLPISEGFHPPQPGHWPIFAVLAHAKMAPSTYYAAKTGPPPARAIADADLDERIEALFDKNYRAERWNTDPKPLIRKATAEDILTKVQRGAILRQINSQTHH